MNSDERFYFANLCADVLRCVKAAMQEDEERYRNSLARARRTLLAMRANNRPEAHEEGLLLVRGLQLAKMAGNLKDFEQALNKITPHVVA